MNAIPHNLFDFKRSIDRIDEKSKTGRHWIYSGHELIEQKHNKLISSRGFYFKSPLFEHTAMEEAFDPLKIQLLASYHETCDILKNHYANPLSSLVTSKTMLLPHQVQAAIHVMDMLKPRILIADEVGLGKTVEAGLIIKELILKYNYKKVLIVMPAPLVYQWQSELKLKFNEDFTIINGSTLKKNPGVMNQAKKVIVSIDLLREKNHWGLFLHQNFDIVVFDEAHRLRKDQNKTTRGYQFAEQISKNCKALMLLSATPFRGKLEEIYFLIQLIDPDILGPLHTFSKEYEGDNSYLNRRISPVVIRRRKKDIGGFTQRFAKTIKVTLSPIERAFYDAMTDYVKKEYNRALEAKQNIKAFIMIVFQKMLDSSSFALVRSLEKRKAKLEKIYYRIPGAAQTFIDDNEFQNLLINQLDDEDVQSELVDNSLAFNPAEIRNEIFSLSKLIDLGNKIHTDTKLKIIKNSIATMKARGHEKIIIFTQFKKTLEYIETYLKPFYKVTVFHGGLSGKDKESAIEEFFTKTEIFICTEAGGEGRNLQIASALINYDLPWSPLKIEQRIGRIHRFGQTKDVHVLNMACRDTIAEKVIDILEKKIKLFEDAFGQSDELLGMTEDDTSFEESIISLLKNKKSAKENARQMENSLKLAKENVHKINSLLTTEVLDFNMNAFRQAIDQKENQYDNEHKLEKIFFRYMDKYGCPYKKNGKIIKFEWNTESIEGTFYLEITNDSPSIQYLTLGHPVIDSIIQTMVNRFESHSAFYVKSNKNGTMFNYKVFIHLDRTYIRYFNIYMNEFNVEEIFMNDHSYSEHYAEKIDFDDIHFLIEKSLQSVEKQLVPEIERLQNKIKCGVGYWKSNIQKSHSNIEEELIEKLEVQKGKAHWYGEEKMHSAIQRTINKKVEENIRTRQRLQFLDTSLNLKVEIELKHITFFRQQTAPLSF